MLLRLAFKLIDVTLKECAPWQLATGVCLGLALGLGVPHTLHWLLVVAIALFMRVYLPVLALTWFVALPLGLSLRPFFHRIGEPFIVGGWLPEGFLAQLYHSPLVPYTMFYNTVVMGHAILMVVVLPPIYFALVPFFGRYRERFLSGLERSNLWMGFTRSGIYRKYAARKEEAREGILRWHAVATVPFLLAVIGIYLLGFSEGHLKGYLEETASRFHGAKVSIRSLRIHWKENVVELGGVEAADPVRPLKNLFALENVRFRINPGNLLRKKIIIPEAEIQGIHYATGRRGSGELPADIRLLTGGTGLLDRVSTGIYSGIRKEQGQSPLRFLGRIATGMDLTSQMKGINYKMRAARQVEQLRQSVDKAEHRWAELVSGAPDVATLQDLAQLVSELPARERAPAAKAQGSDVAGRIASFREKTKTAMETVSSESSALQKEIEGIDQTIADDIAGARRELGIPQIADEDITPMVFGPRLVAYLERISYWVEWLRRHMPKGTPQKMIESRLEGISVHFAMGNAFPWLHVGKVTLISEGRRPGAGKVTGLIEGFNSAPSLWGQPLKIEIDADFPTAKITGVKLRAIIDHTGQAYREELSLAIDSFPFENWTVHEAGYLNITVQKAHGSLQFHSLYGDDGVETAAKIRFHDADYKVTSQYKQFEQLLEEALKPINAFTLTASIKGSYDHPQISLGSEVGRKLAADLRREYRHEIGAIEDSLRGFIIDKLALPRETLSNKFAELRRRTTEPLHKTLRTLEDLQSLADKKLGSHP